MALKPVVLLLAIMAGVWLRAECPLPAAEASEAARCALWVEYRTAA